MTPGAADAMRDVFDTDVFGLNGRGGFQTVEQGAEIIVRMARVDRDGPTGGYFQAAGPIPG